MNPTEWVHVKELFAQAVEHPAEEREQFLSDACAGDEQMESYLRRLVAAHSSGIGFLDRPPMPVARVLSSRELAPNAFRPGDTAAGRFQILAFLGRGGMGEVYEAFDSELQESVALKTIRPDVASDPRIVECFKGEVTRARQIVSPNVCRVYDMFRHRRESGEDVVFLTMELLSGETLAETLRTRGKYTTAEAFPLICQLSEGLAAAHDAGIIHRDFKSSNVMLVPQGESMRAVITDFGLARNTIDGNRKSQAATDPFDEGGTPAYMAPEQVEGKPVTFATDVYALGVVAYEMVTGRQPFEGETAMATAVKRLQERPPSPRALVPDLDRPWESAILRCLEQDPAKRFQNAREIIQAIAGEDLSVSRHPRKRWIAWGAAAMLALTMSSAAYFVGTLGKRAPEPNPAPPRYSIAVLPFKNLDSARKSKYFSDGITDELIDGLTQVSDLRVIARSSAFRFEDSALPLQDIARQLGVRYLIIGTVQRDNGRLRLTAKLMDPANGFQLWSKAFDDDEREAFSFRAQTVWAITAALGIRPSSPPPGPVVATNSAAHSDYLMGRFLLAKRTDAGLAEALTYFESAAAGDPKYAPIQTGLAETYSVMAERGLLPSMAAHQKSKEAALRALSLDNTLAESYVALGTLSSTSGKDFRAAETYYLQALALNPGLATAHQSYSYMLSKLRRFDESLHQARLALEIDPFSNPANINLAVQFFYTRDYQALVQQCRKMLELDPQHFVAHLLLAEAMAHLGDGPAAYRELEAVGDRPKDHPLTVRTHAEVGTVLGRPDLAEIDLQSLLREKKRTDSFASSYIAIVYAGLGQKDRAFEWLEKAYAEHDSFLSVLQVYPAYDSLRSDPRYASLLSRLGFTEETARGSARTP